MRRLAIIARLKSGREERAAELIAKARRSIPRKAASTAMSSSFPRPRSSSSEGTEVDARLDDLIENPFRWMVSDAFDEWRPLIEDHPRIARERYFWERAPE